MSSVDESLNFSRSENWFKSLFDFSSFNNIQLFSDFFNLWLNDVLIINNITIDGNGSWFLFVASLNWKTPLSFDNSVLFLLKFGNQLFNSLIDSGGNNYSLSQRLDLIFINYSRLANNSFSDDFWLCCKSLGDDLGFSSDVLSS